MAARKTIKVVDLIKECNRICALPSGNKTAADYRHSVISFTETFLHKTGNYNGFRYLNESETPKGELPGIRDVNGGDRFHNVDSSRISFYLPKG